MEKNHSQSSLPKPQIRYNKETDETTIRVLHDDGWHDIDQPKTENMSEQRKLLNAIACIVMTTPESEKHDLHDELLFVDGWLAEQYLLLDSNELP